ncbi:hypothetical protein KQX54_015958 [Cotesia glomerata]|uniref:Uncharacterized protein n=1 Tax=Cotesia glomerata TaxID=32391 RepID=A0AAV7J0J8_COTGL|nr:hypothetical protein KQX54_015958 [Cotesia glomerata]
MNRPQGIMIDQFMNFNLIIPRFWYDYFNEDLEDLINHIRHELITIVLAEEVFQHPIISIGHLGAELILDESSQSWWFQAPKSRNQIYVLVENGSQRISLNMEASIIDWRNRIDYDLRQNSDDSDNNDEEQHSELLSEPRSRIRAPQAARRPRFAVVSPQPGLSQQLDLNPQPGLSLQPESSLVADSSLWPGPSFQPDLSPQPSPSFQSDLSPPLSRRVTWNLPSSTPEAPQRWRRRRLRVGSPIPLMNYDESPPPPPPPPPPPASPASPEVAAAAEWVPPSLPELELITPPKQRCEFCNANPNSRRCLFPESPTPSTATTVLLSEGRSPSPMRLERRSPSLFRLGGRLPLPMEPEGRLPSPMGSVGGTPSSFSTSEFSSSDVENDDNEYFNNNY